MTPEIRQIASLDAEQLLQLRELYVAAGWISADDPAEFLAPAIAGSTVVAGAFAGDELVGFARALSDGCSDAYIQDVVVSPEFRGQGIGSRLIRFVEVSLRAGGVDWIALVGEPGTEKFYSKLGLKAQSGYTLWKL